ncbi:OmpA family protein [Flavobacterium sp. JP2137]|uniref:OmpA family protein n=1 Tax=Flavobacterium sp. JP2137 TaxID=3414510 RepID=UPI003D300707
MKNSIQRLIALGLLLPLGLTAQEHNKIHGSVYDALDPTQIPVGELVLYDRQGVVQKTQADSQGCFEFTLRETAEFYRITASAPTYNQAEVAVDNPAKTIEVNFGLRTQIQQNAVSNAANFKSIYFDFNSALITAKAAMDLGVVSAYLRANPELKLEIHAYADSRGSARYNMELSQQRAQQTGDWLTEQGHIAPSRLSLKACGKSGVLNSCVEGGECSKHPHQHNRRSELRIVN